MNQTALRTILAAVVIAAVAPSAPAGDVLTQEVTINGSEASGNLHAARHSHDRVQRLGCLVKYSLVFDRTTVVCSAVDKHGSTLTCVSSEPGFAPIAIGISDFSWVQFECADSALISLSVRTASFGLP